MSVSSKKRGDTPNVPKEDALKIEKFLSIIEKVKSISWKNIINSFVKIITIILFFSFTLFIIDPSPALKYFLDVTERIQVEKHEELIDKRRRNTPLINKELQLLLKDLDADRTFIIEFHNGNNNFAALPFWWGDMTYENTADSVHSIRDSWMNVSLTRYNFFSTICSISYWIGDIEDVKHIDQDFAKKLDADDVEYIATLLLYNTEGKPLGLLGASFKRDSLCKSKKEMTKLLIQYSQAINPLLIGL